jgi:hypothetical protein
MIRIVEYPTLKFSRIAAGIINTNAIQLQFLLNQVSFSVKFSKRTRTIDINPQGNKRKVEGLPGVTAIVNCFVVNRKVEIFPGILRLDFICPALIN